MRTRLFFAAVAALALTGIAQAADPLQPPDTSRFLRWGPLRVRPGFAVPGIGYDDNIFSQTDTNDAQGDFVAKLSPRIEGLLFFGQAGFLTFRERFDYVTYATYQDQNYYENHFESRATFPFRRWGVFGDFGVQRLRDAPATEIDTRPIRREARWGVGAILNLGWRTDAEIGYYESVWTNYDADYTSSTGFTIGQLLDRTAHGPRVKIRYRMTGLTRLTLDARFRDIVFDDPDVDRDSTERTILPGLEFGQGGTLSGTVKLGNAVLDSKDPTAPDFDGPVGEVALAYRVTSATRLRLEGGRRVSFAVYQDYRYFQSDFWEFRGVHYLNRLFGLEGAIGAGRNEFPDATGSDPRVDHVTRYEAGLRFRLPESVLGRTAEYTLGVQRLFRNSNIDTIDLERTVLVFGASVGF